MHYRILFILIFTLLGSTRVNGNHREEFQGSRLDFNFNSSETITSISVNFETTSESRCFLLFPHLTNSCETELTYGYNLMDILQNSASHYQRLGEIKNLILPRMLEIQFAHLTAKERRFLWRKLKRINVRLQEYKCHMKSQKKSWIQTKTGTTKGLKELGNKDDRLIIESELLKAGIESNPGPSSEMTSKMPRYQKWSRELSQWLLPYVKRCETTLTLGYNFYFPF